MIYYEEYKDLFSVNADNTSEPYNLAHCISADFGMFGGIVVEFNRRFNMKQRLIEKYHSKEEEFLTNGPMCLAEECNDEFGNIFTVYNLVTKPTVASLPTYITLELSLFEMREMMKIQGCKKLAIPTIGCGIDGLDWEVVRELIHYVFAGTDIEILVCKLEESSI